MTRDAAGSRLWRVHLRPRSKALLCHFTAMVTAENEEGARAKALGTRPGLWEIEKCEEVK